jgi:hypothetical protein
MAQHRIARDNLDEGLMALVRGSSDKIDHLSFDDATDEWVVITTDRFETRPATTFTPDEKRAIGEYAEREAAKLLGGAA